MAEEHFHIVIIGAGLAGLSLAYRLCAPQFAHLRIAIVDPRTSFGATHTWSFWQQTPHPFMDLVRPNRQWCSLWVQAAGVISCPHDFSAAPYCSIESTHFYAKCLDKMAGNLSIKSFYGHRANSVAKVGENSATVSLTNLISGESQNLHAKLVFDSRPAVLSAAVGNNAWIQAFAGWEVVCATAPFAPMIAAHEAVLMDFMPSIIDATGKAIPTFIYLLPSSPTQALVQATVFVPPNATVPSDITLQALAVAYLRAKFGDAEIAYQSPEVGRIVMDAAIAPMTVLQTITKIGSAGGFVRASTGYSFTRTQRACDALGIAILKALPISSLNAKTGSLPIKMRWQSNFAPWLDAVFLEAVATQGLDVGQLMVRLFNTVRPLRLVRFLDGNARTNDVLVVIAACPKWVFLRSFFVCLGRWLRSRGSRDYHHADR